MSSPKTNVVLKAVLFVMLVGWMALIFFFSSENSTESSKTSTDTLTGITGIVIPSEKQENLQTFVNDNQILVRKLAHITLFAVLGLISVALLSVSFVLRKMDRFLISSAFCCFYAAFDELHQFFVPGRSGTPADVFMDTVGAVIAISAFLLVEYLIEKKCGKRLCFWEN